MCLNLGCDFPLVRMKLLTSVSKHCRYSTKQPDIWHLKYMIYLHSSMVFGTCLIITKFLMLTAEVIRKGSVMSSTCRSKGSQDTSAGKAIWLGAVKWRCNRQETFLLTKTSSLAMVLTQPPIQWAPGAFSPGVKWLERVVKPSLFSNIELRNEWGYTSNLPYASKA